MNSLLYYYNNVQKMAAYRQAKRMQRGVLTAQGGFSMTDPALLHVPCTIQCVFVPQTFESRQCVFDTRGSNASPRIDILENGRMSIYYSGTNKTIDISIGTLYNITFVTTETEQSVYVGGELLGSAPYSTPQFAYYVIGALTDGFMYRFKGDYLLHRHFNYAMSADEVKALDNNGDPMGYVVPKAMRELLSVNLIGSNSFTWDGSDSPYYYNITGNPITIGKYYKINVTVSDYQSGSPRIFAGISYPIPAQNGTFDIVVYNERYVNNFPIYGGSDGDPNRHLTITVNSITSVGLLAEYLPQNLMESRKGPAVEPKAKIYEFNIGDEYYKSVLTQAKYPYDCIYRVDYVVDEWDYQPKPIGSVGFLGLTGATILTPDGQDWSTLEKAKVGESRTLLVKMPGSGTPALYIYGGNDDETATARHLKVTIKGITPVSVPISWLDSAKQFPLNDEYLPPLLQSDGGYDLTANGTPQIIIK
jgi:hypothetical protein|nr:MAG TPA: Concanavalin A-like lectin/glucanase superfamily protein [Bacteriophage sp.]DAS26032.1 MAG TPA: Concanavalin A-like lectin/glucanase superfamily protein [Caudoviricetes sp.]DAS37885.1 MAG TPA: Concanavalin A-like lectin/glucanase superfamily protein [Caudoviricetes sp.]